MSNKEAIFLVLDMGSSMQELIQQSRGEQQQITRAQMAIQCIKILLQQKMFNYKTHEVGLILFGLDQSQQEGSTMYIRQMGKPDMDFLKNVIELENYSDNKCNGGDIFDALEKALITIDEYVKKKKYEKKIYLFTAGCGQTDYNSDQLNQLVNKIQNVNAKINVIGFDFLMKYNPEREDQDIELTKLNEDDENQTKIQNLNQKLLFVIKRELASQIQFFPSFTALSIQKQFRSRSYAPRVKAKGKFQISDILDFDVVIYTKTNEDKLPGLKQFSVAVDFDKSDKSGLIQREVIRYIQEDPNMQPVDKENIGKAYYYGKQLVPLSTLMENQLKLETVKEIKLLGFLEKKDVPRQAFMGGIDILKCLESDLKAKQGVAAMVKAMKVLGKYALVRNVQRNNATPKLCVLIPQMGEDYEYFYMVELPTAESVRDFQFNSLKQSTQEQQELVEELMDKLDLCKEDEDEVMNMKYIYNPTKQYFYQCVFDRAFNPDDELPPMNQSIKEYMCPEEDLGEEFYKKIKTMFKLEKGSKPKKDLKEGEVEEEEQRKIFWKDLLEEKNTEQILVEQSDLETQQIQIQKKFTFDDNDDYVKKVSLINPIDDFKQMITNKKVDLVQSAINQMSDIIISFIHSSIKGSNYEKAFECLKVFRQGCLQEDEASAFNQFLTELKKKFSNSNQKQFWKLVINQGITLITSNENRTSTVTTQEATKFLQEEYTQVLNIEDFKLRKQEDDILDELD